MNNTHEIVFKCDTNDADYITSEHQYNPLDPTHFIKPGELFDYHRGVTYFQFVNALGKAINMPRTTSHNWSRDEYDDIDCAHETCAWVIAILFGVDINTDEWHEAEETRNKALTIMHEIISDQLPYGEFGVHTIEKISSRELISETVIGKDENHPLLSQAVFGAWFMEEYPLDETVHFYNDKFEIYLFETKTWAQTGYSSREHMEEMGAQFVWEKN